MNPEEFSRLRRSATIGPERDKSPISGSSFWRGTVTVIAVALGQFCGINIVIPFAFALIVGLVAFKCFSTQRRAIVPALCIQAGQWLWMAIGIIMLEGRMHIVAAHPIGVLAFGVYGIGLLWFAVRPDNTSLWFLIVFHVLNMPFNIYSLMHTPFGSPLSKGLIVHIFVRCVALALMWELNRKWGDVEGEGIESSQHV